MSKLNPQNLVDSLKSMLYPQVAPATKNFGTYRCQTPTGVVFRPLILGGDLGGLSQARSYWEEYGQVACILAKAPTPYHYPSHTREIQYQADLDEPERLIQLVNEVAKLDDTPMVVTTSYDFYVSILTRLRTQLVDNVIVPYTSFENITRLTDKSTFSQLCQASGVAHPRSVTVSFPAGDQLSDLQSLPFPIVAKPAVGDDYEKVEFAGKEKVFYLHHEADVTKLVDNLVKAGFRGDFIFQERIPGNDSQMRILTCFMNHNHELTLASYGSELIEEHDPLLRGNPAAIYTGVCPPHLVEQARSLLQAAGWYGFANFDIKVDPRDGTAYFFELNPRLGRSNYYMNVNGVNPVRFLIDAIFEDDLSDQTLIPKDEGLYLVVPFPLAFAYADGRRLALLKALFSARVKNPLINTRSKPHSALISSVAAVLNQYRRFARFYPLSQHRKEMKS